MPFMSPAQAVQTMQAVQAVQAVQPAQAVQAVGGSAAPGSPMGLITARDGTVGAWREDGTPPEAWHQGTDENLSLWPSWSRLFILSNDILTALEIRLEDGDAILRYRGPIAEDGTANYAPLCVLRRPETEDFVAQSRIVAEYAELRPERSAEIVDQISGTLPYFRMLLPIVADRMPYTLELLALTQAVAAHAAQHIKHLLACKRPDAFSAQIQPMIPTPGHGALPSGHATEAFATAEVLRNLVPSTERASGLDDGLMDAAARIAINRTVAGLHFPADSYAGAVLGLAVADFLVASAADQPQSLPARGFHGPGIGQADFFTSSIWTSGERQDVSAARAEGVIGTEETDAKSSVPLSPRLRWLWSAATNEWKTPGP